MSTTERNTRDDVLPAAYRDCFGCGDDNRAGIHLSDIRKEDGVVKATLRPRDEHQGFPGMLHGGIATAALDEVMGYACVLIGGHWAVTGRMELRFRRPAHIGQELFVEGGLDEASGERRYKTWARIVDADGNVLIQATGLFLPVPDSMMERFEA